MTFEFCLRYLGFLKNIPFLPWVADALMLLWSVTFNRSVYRTIIRLEDEVTGWEGVDITIHKYGGLQFNLGNVEIGHIHSNGVLDLLLDRKTRDYLVNHRLAQEHHTFKKSGWVTYYIRSEGDYELAVSLMKMGYERVSDSALKRQRSLPTKKQE